MTPQHGRNPKLAPELGQQLPAGLRTTTGSMMTMSASTSTAILQMRCTNTSHRSRQQGAKGVPHVCMHKIVDMRTPRVRTTPHT